MLRTASAWLRVKGEEESEAQAESVRAVQQGLILAPPDAAEVVGHAGTVIKASLELRRTQATSEFDGNAVQQASALNAEQWVEACRAIEENPSTKGVNLATQAYAAGRQEADALAQLAVVAAVRTDGVESGQFARTTWRVAQAMPASRLSLAESYLGRSMQALRSLGSAENGYFLAARLSQPISMAYKGWKAGNPSIACKWLASAFDEVPAIVSAKADKEAQSDIAMELGQLSMLAQTLGEIGQARRAQDMFDRYTTERRLTNARVTLVLDRIQRHLSDGEIDRAGALMKEVDAILARPSNLETDERRTAHNKLKSLRDIHSALTADDGAVALEPREMSGWATSILRLKNDAEAPEWLNTMGSRIGYPLAQRLHLLADAMSRSEAGMLSLSAAHSAELGLKALEVAAQSTKDDTAARFMNRSFFSSAAVARWPLVHRIALYQTRSWILQRQGKRAEALAAIARAVELSYTASSSAPKGPLYDMLLMHLDSGDVDSAKRVAAKMRTVRAAEGESAQADALILSLGEAKIAQAEGDAVAVRRHLEIAAQRYLPGSVASGQDLWVEVANKAQAAVATGDRVALRLFTEAMSMLVKANDDACNPDVDRSASEYYLWRGSQLHLRFTQSLGSDSSWYHRMQRTAENAATIEVAVELALRAQAEGKRDHSVGLYRELQQFLGEAQSSLPRPAGWKDTQEPEFALLKGALIERLLLSNKPDVVGSVLSGDWDDSRFRSAGVGELPQDSVVHLVAYSPTQLGNDCDVRHRANRRVAIFVLRGGKVVMAAAGPLLSEVVADSAALVGEIQTRAAESADRSSLRLFDALLRKPAELLAGESMFNVMVDPSIPLIPVSLLLQRHGTASERDAVVRHVLPVSMNNRLARLKPARGPALVLAAPEYGVPQPGVQPFSELIHSEGEGISVARLAGVTPHLHREASLLTLLEANRPRLVHLSTHSSVLQSRVLKRAVGGGRDADHNAPLNALLALANARVALTRANERGAGLVHGGFITAFMFSALRLQGTGLVVFSSCESALNSEVVTNAAVGLLWAAHEAGAKSVLGTLWKIDDESSAHFMTLFYSRLLQGSRPAQALAGAQVEMRELPPKAEWSHPYHWAAYVLSGTNEGFAIR